MDNQTTIGRLFGEDMITFVIPSYQRAYSWDKEQAANHFHAPLKEEAQKCFAASHSLDS